MWRSMSGRRRWPYSLTISQNKIAGSDRTCCFCPVGSRCAASSNIAVITSSGDWARRAATRPQEVSPAAVPTSVLPHKTKRQSQLQKVSPMPAPIQLPAHDMLQSQAVIATGKSQLRKLESVAQASAVSATVPTTSPTAAVAAPSGPIASKPGDLPQPGSGPRGDIHVQQLGAGNHPSGHSEDAELGAGVPLGRYFELGRFRDDPGANNAAGRAAQAGFHTMVVQKARLWVKSYHLLAGPYGNEHEAEAARRNLKSIGFTPRTLEGNPVP